MSRFKIEKCKIPKVYCGNGDWKTAKPNNYSKYYKNGTSHECVKSGIGAGMMIEKVKGLGKSSLQNIPYVGPTYEANFRKKKVATISALIKRIDDKSKDYVKKFLESVFTKSNGSIDHKGINSVIMYLYGKGYTNMPSCKKIVP